MNNLFKNTELLAEASRLKAKFDRFEARVRVIRATLNSSIESPTARELSVLY